ncbi:EAL domain-containing protein [Paenibacillus turpanensis]|uniref:EAL domain-containing protein n=1 Tax=Paenibacillus turpanensis TaxID=2689078 RepID=UPI00140B83EC|nr:EAL domain-containing protein [Paenibacillus turpanensis]
MAVEIFLRDRRNTLNRLAAAVFLMMLLLLTSDFFTKMFPLEYSQVLTRWFKLIPAFLIQGFILHFYSRLTDRFARWSFIRTAVTCYLPAIPLALLFYPSDLFYIQVNSEGVWKAAILSPALYMLVIIPAVYTLTLSTYFLATGRRHIKRTHNSPNQRKQIRLIMIGTVIGGAIAIFGSYFNPLLMFSDSFSYPEPSSLGMVFFALMVRYAMTKYEFFPSIERKYKILYDRSPMSILLFNDQGQVIESNPASLALFRKSRREMLRCTYNMLLAPYSGTAASPSARANIVVTNVPGIPERLLQVDSEMITSGGETYKYMLLHDVTDNLIAEQNITYMAYHDALTGLYNRRKFQETLQEITQASQASSRYTAVLLLDLDKFKHINDTKGHLAGDRMLQHFSLQLQKHAGQALLISRLGGDEFALLVNSDSSEEIEHLCQSILIAFAVPFIADDEQFYITASIGISMYPDYGTDPEQLLQYADIAMYESKRNGRNRYTFFHSGMVEQEKRRHTLEARLRSAIAEERFALVYQPQIDLESGQVCGLEALVRWREPDGTFISPVEFIPVAEDTGLIVPLGKWVLKEACATAKRWMDQGLPEISLSVNVSFRELTDEEWYSGVNTIVAASGFPSRLVHLEMTESSIIADEHQVKMVCNQLLSQGFQLAIDDFGTGYSTFAVIQTLPFQYLKIDKSIIQNIEDSANTQTIVKAMISMARSLGQRVVAEGVETAGQADILRGLGCHSVQGYYFSRPLPEKEALQWVLQFNDSEKRGVGA